MISNKLHLGSGPHYAEGWMNVDMDPMWRADVYADVLAWLPFTDNTFDQIYLGHVLEHLPWASLTPAWRELQRVAAPGCRVAVVGPAMDLALAQGESSALIAAIQAHDPPPGGHAWTATTELTRQACELGGLIVEEVSVETIHMPEWCNTVPWALWQCAFIGGWPE